MKEENEGAPQLTIALTIALRQAPAVASVASCSAR